MINVGIIGVGGMGSFHARTLAGLAGVSVGAVSDPHEPNAAAVKAQFGSDVVDDPFELISSAPIDGLVIASPDETHPDLVIAAIERGIPVLCEKPLATRLDDARRVLDAEVATARRWVQLGFMREFDPAHRQVESELGELGPIDYVRAVHRNTNERPRPLAEIVGQSMVHDVHTVRWLTNAEITSVMTSAAGVDGDSFRHIVALCSLSSGAHAVVEFDDAGFAYDVSVEALTVAGDALTGRPTRAVRRRAGSIDVYLGHDWFGWFADAYRIQNQAWVDSIRSGAVTGPTTWDGYAAQAVVDAILASLATGERVDIAVGDPPALYR